MSLPTPTLLEVRGLSVHFGTEHGVLRAVDDVSWRLEARQTLAIVGESGCGKSVSALAVMGLLPTPPARLAGGEILTQGRPVSGLSDRQRRRLRGSQIAMIFQDPLTSLNPVHRVGYQIVEMIRAHQSVNRRQAGRQAIDLLREVGIPDAPMRAKQYPHELSGGMRQRIMIAMALANDPQVLIADEPTTALDVTVQAQVMALLRRLQQRRGTALVLITHDLGVVAGVADQIVVMYAGRIVEAGTAEEVFYTPRHPYTLGLLAGLPRTDHPVQRRMTPIPGAPPNLADLPAGCPFRPRCRFAIDECSTTQPPLQRLGASQHASACLRSATLAPISGSTRT